jgi:hypothetical protein
MMTGEIEYDKLFFPIREEITPRDTLALPLKSTTVQIPNLTSADISSFSKAQYFPITAHVLAFFAILLVSVVIFNLILGIAVSDVQVI